MYFPGSTTLIRFLQGHVSTDFCLGVEQNNCEPSPNANGVTTPVLVNMRAAAADMHILKLFILGRTALAGLHR